MTNNVVAAAQQALAMCRRDGGSLFVVVCTRHDGTNWTSATFPEPYAQEFAETEKLERQREELPLC